MFSGISRHVEQNRYSVPDSKIRFSRVTVLPSARSVTVEPRNGTTKAEQSRVESTTGQACAARLRRKEPSTLKLISGAIGEDGPDCLDSGFRIAIERFG